MKKKAIIIGAGPAGLTAAYELVNKTNIQPIIIEMSSEVGGLSKTINHNGNRIDLGGHRFFSKSDRVMNWWLNILPLEEKLKESIEINYHNKSYKINESANHREINTPNHVLLIRQRLSRIYYKGNLFEYPIKLTLGNLRKLGFVKTLKIIFSYASTLVLPRKEEKSLEDFFITRFGKELYQTFFKEYTEKVWGIPCSEISAEWGKQRIKKLSILKTLTHSCLKSFGLYKSQTIGQKNTETSLIEKFLYPMHGPGQMWEETARLIIEKGGEIHYNIQVSKIIRDNNTILSIIGKNQNGEEVFFSGDYFFSTMAVKDLIIALDPKVPDEVYKIGLNLQYRDFITIGLLVSELKISNNKSSTIKDNWIYIQEPNIKIGRLQIYNNWSPGMVSNNNQYWLGLEYFCNKGDSLWNLSDTDFIDFAIGEMEKLGFIEKKHAIDSVIIRVDKAYPAYFGAYSKFGYIREYMDKFENLFLIGRNGMHKYNNADHSMLTAMTAVDNIINNYKSKKNIWDINTEEDYHET